MTHLIIIAESARHKRFAQQLMWHLKDVFIVIVPKGDKDWTNDPFFWRRNTLVCTVADLHSDTVINKLHSLGLERGFVFGAPLLGQSVLDTVKGKIINLHTGLTQHYRGVDSTIWAVYNNDLTNVGVTLHYIDQGIDTGDVIAQETISYGNDETLDTVIEKAYELGIDLLIKILPQVLKDKMKPKTLKKQGKLYQNADMSEDVKAQAAKNLLTFIRQKRIPPQLF